MKKYIFPAIATALFASAAGAGNSTVSTIDDLVSALSKASNGDVVTLVAGTYSPMSPIEVNAANVTLVSAAGKAVTIIDGDASGRILRVMGSGFRVEGITFQNAHIASNGGAIKAEGQNVTATLKIVDCDFINCAAKYGGAIDAVNEDYNSFAGREQYGLVSGCTFRECMATNSEMWCGGGAINGALWIEDSTFDDCRSNEARQGHAAIAVSGYTTVTNCVFANHKATLKGLVGTGRNPFNNTYPNGKTRVIDCQIVNSTFVGSSDALFDSKVLLDRCVISNTASTVANSIPALYNSPSSNASEARITSCLFVDNGCPFKTSSMPPVENCTFVRNVGGLACDSVTTPILMTNCVFWANVEKTDWPYGASYKGVPGLYWHPSIHLANFVQVGNTVIEGGTADANADVAEVLATDDSGNSTALTAAAAADPKGAGFKDAANGDWSLKRSSVLVDAGVWADWMDSARDIAGNRRCLKKGLVKDGALPDIGCYEFCAVAGFKISLR